MPLLCVAALLLAQGPASSSASPFFDLRAVDVMDVVRGIWKRSTIPRVPSQPTQAEFATLPPATGPGSAGAPGHLGLDFTWNDTVAHVWIDTMTPGSVVAAPATLYDGRLQLTHVAGPLQATPSSPARGPLLGVNVTLEECSAEGVWQPLAHPLGAKGPALHADNLTLYGIYGGLLHIPLAPVWGMLSKCQTHACTHSVVRAPPAALLQALQGSSSSGSAAPDLAAARALLTAAARGSSSRAAGAAAAPAFSDVGVHLGPDSAVLVGYVGASPPGAAKAATAAAAAAAHAASLQHTPRHRELLFGATSYFFPPATRPPPPPPATCPPRSMRLTALEWSFAPQPLHLLARLALSNDAWLQAYSRDLGESLGGWERYLRDLTHSGSALLSRESCVLQHNDPSPAACAGAVAGPATAPRVRSEASWVLLDGLTHKRSQSPGEAAAAALGPGAGFTGLGPPTLPGAANVSFFKLLHWWPGYDLDAAIEDVRGVGTPGLASFVLAPPPRTTLLLRTFGESWVIACYMLFSGAIISVHALSVCYGEARHRKRMLEGGGRGKGAKGERRERGGSAAAHSDLGEAAAAAPGSSSSSSSRGGAQERRAKK